MSCMVASNAWAEIIHHASDGILEERWLPGQMTDGAFVASLALLALEAERLRPSAILIDATQFQYRPGPTVRGTEVWQIWIDAIHQLQDGYSADWVRVLNLDLLQPLPLAGESHRRPMGTLSVEADACGFRLERDGEILVASDDSSGKALTVFPQLLGRTLLRVEASPPAREAVLRFDDDLALRCFPANSEGRAGWSLHPSNSDSTRTR